MAPIKTSWRFGGGIIDGFFEYASYGAYRGGQAGLVVGAVAAVALGFSLPAAIGLAIGGTALGAAGGTLGGAAYGTVVGGFEGVRDGARADQQKVAIKRLTNARYQMPSHTTPQAHHHSNVRDNLLRYQHQKDQSGGAIYESVNAATNKNWVKTIEEQEQLAQQSQEPAVAGPA